MKADAKSVAKARKPTVGLLRPPRLKPKKKVYNRKKENRKWKKSLRY